jgi:hypothetical protein
MHPDLRDVKLLLDAIAQPFEERRVEILARELANLGA